jgi:membrane glycosyltransferase
MVLGSVSVGRRLARAGLLLIPEETSRPPVLENRFLTLANLQGEALFDHPEPFVSVLSDPAFYALHIGILRATNSDVPLSCNEREHVKRAISPGGIQALPADLRRSALSDLYLMEWLHVSRRAHSPATRSPLAGSKGSGKPSSSLGTIAGVGGDSAGVGG